MNLRLPVISGTIARRLLVNFRADPDVIRRFLPAPFRPKIINGVGLIGICLIRLERMRPKGLPAFCGFNSENGAHRIAVEWDVAGRRCEGVFIPRRDTSSRINALVGGRVFPGVHHHSQFNVEDSGGRCRINVIDETKADLLSVCAHESRGIEAGSIFATMHQASEFFRCGSVGYSVRRETGVFDGLELHAFQWEMRPLKIEWARSSFFFDERRFPKGSVVYDSAFLMRGIEHEWHQLPVLGG